MTAAQRHGPIQRGFGHGVLTRARRGYHALRRRPWGSSQDHPRLDPTATRDELSTDVGLILASHQGRLVHKWLQYPPAYSQHFAEFRNGVRSPGGDRRPLRFLEIGVSHGGSLEVWRQYFGPEAIIVGIDIDERCTAFDGEAARVRIGSQDDPAFVRSVVAEMGGVDIVLDDGSHVARHQRASFEVLFPLLEVGGLYVVEDLHTAYWAKFGGGLRRRGTFVEVVKDLADDMHAPYHRRSATALPPGCAVDSITLHDSLVVIRKGTRAAPMTIVAGTPSF